MTYITESMIYSTMKYQMTRSQNNWMSNVEKSASGLRVSNAEDDPDAAAKVSVIKDALLQMDGMDRVATSVGTRIDDTLNAMEKMIEILDQALNNDIASGNATLNPKDRERIANVMLSAQQAFLQQANATSNGRYLFAGAIDDTAPYELDGTYHGDDGVANLEVGPNLWVDANVPGSKVVNVTGGQNILGVLDSLVTSLNANDRDGIQKGLSNLHSSHDQLTLAVASVGGPQATIRYASGLRSALGMSLKTQRSNLEEADYTSTASDMMASSTSMQAAIAVTQQVIRALDAAARA